MAWHLSAPGKMMIAGEYVVLEGAEALVAAVDRRATMTYDPRPSRERRAQQTQWGRVTDRSGALQSGSEERLPLPPEALLARHLAAAFFPQPGPDPFEMILDVRPLRDGAQKLGLGSSAAAAAAGSAAVFAAWGESLDERRRDVLEAALEGHRTIAPRGSGADVAASVLGGFVKFQRHEEARVEAASFEWPAGLESRVVWTGQEARTSELVARVDRLKALDPTAHEACFDAIRQAAARMIEAARIRDVAALIEATAAHHDAMRELGEAAEAPIVEERLEAVADLARSFGGAAKPSGAGGGDVSLVFLPDTDAASRFDEGCPDAGLELVPLELGAPGVRLETSAASDDELPLAGSGQLDGRGGDAGAAAVRIRRDEESGTKG